MIPFVRRRVRNPRVLAYQFISEIHLLVKGSPRPENVSVSYWSVSATILSRSSWNISTSIVVCSLVISL